jgi:hypothetical protein
MKRYQVFVSSTYSDLEEERQQIIQALIQMNHIPIGMELFPAADEEQLKFIKKIIDDCDYYILIIGARYGSTTSDGISYTEKEYDYAIGKGIKVIALLHKSPNDLSPEKSESNAENRRKLYLFRDKVSKGRIVRFWESTAELIKDTILSLQYAITTFPATGWIRADKAPREELLEELNDVRKENEQLKIDLDNYVKSNEIEIPNLAPLEDAVSISGTWYKHGTNTTWGIEITWKDIFGVIAPYIFEVITESSVKLHLTQCLFKKSEVKGEQPYLDDQTFQTIKIQFLAHKLILVRYLKTQGGDWAWFWSLTPKGESLMMELRAVRARKS